MSCKRAKVTRRNFIRDTAIMTASVAAAGAIIEGQPSIVAAGAVDVPPEVTNTRSYNPNMEYRRLGKTGIWASAICLGGHWKRIDKVIGSKEAINPYVAPTDQAGLGPFLKNRYDVVTRCIEVGINLIDFAGDSEPETYCEVLKDRREKMYLAYSHPASELRVPENRTKDKLIELFKAGLKRCKLEYADIWRLMALERGGTHSQADVDAMIGALDSAKKEGLCRFTGLSTHDRLWAKQLIESYPDTVQVLVTPYTATTRELPVDSLFDAIRKHDVGMLGIKPFASNAIFQGDGSPESPHAEEDSCKARLAIRNILCNPAVTAPIPGLISIAQVDNMAAAVRERRELDREEKAQLEQWGKEMWANLPGDYEWLKDWEYV
jgi:aryl-alcohol dehydrogenase-like predicted oxidoreductase